MVETTDLQMKKGLTRPHSAPNITGPRYWLLYISDGKALLLKIQFIYVIERGEVELVRI